MNVLSLIRQHPLLFADLKNLGLSHNTLHHAAVTLSVQLGGSAEYNLCNVLAGMNAREFIRLIDPKLLAQETGVKPALAQSIVLTIAPWIDQFQLQAN